MLKIEKTATLIEKPSRPTPMTPQNPTRPLPGANLTSHDSTLFTTLFTLVTKDFNAFKHHSTPFNTFF
jgi:hypothetical protein